MTRQRFCTVLVPVAFGLCTTSGCSEDLPERRAIPFPTEGADVDGAVSAPTADDDAGVAMDAAADAVVDGGNPDSATADAEISGCGDGVIQPGEACDDSNNVPADGCASDCSVIERGFGCPTPGQACVSTVRCGDGHVVGPEECDDGNTRAGDGCNEACELEPGAACPTPGAACVAAACGDGLVSGGEQCDDGDDPPEDGDGCSAQCKLEPGFVCDPEEGCRATVCNDGVREGGEACDDGNLVVGDGCTPLCDVEPNCEEGTCHSRCGDGLILPVDDEACDDGNTTDGDGCSATCEVEAGYACTLEVDELPDVLTVPVTYRDFISKPISDLPRHPDFQTYSGSDVSPGLVAAQLGMDGKPVYNDRCDQRTTDGCPFGQQLSTRDDFDQWYRDTDGINITKVEPMRLDRDPDGGAYRISNAAFFPWDKRDARGWLERGQEGTTSGHNFGFTSEIHHFFEYDPDPGAPQTLTFSGDDDVWVFINRRLAVDIGGIHKEVLRTVTLDASTAESLGLEPGNIYEIAIFHAERHTSDSNFNLTLDGFVAARSVCVADCGDGIVAGEEACDDGVNDGSYGTCTSDCQRGPYCGDGIVQEDEEQCDDGLNVTGHAGAGNAGCAPGCVASAYCGDGNVDSLFGEECDDGENPGGYGQCSPDCRLGPRCGDDEIQDDEGEECDDENLVNGDGCDDRCQFERPI